MLDSMLPSYGVEEFLSVLAVILLADDQYLGCCFIGPNGTYYVPVRIDSTPQRSKANTRRDGSTLN